MGLPVAASQSRAVPSEDAVTMRLPSGLNFALFKEFALMTFERVADGLAGSGVPKPRRSVERRSDDTVSVRTERRAPHFVLMTFQRLADRLAGRRIPDLRRPVIRSSDDLLAIGAEDGADHSAIMANKRLADRLAGVRVPNIGRTSLKTSSDDLFAVGAKMLRRSLRWSWARIKTFAQTGAATSTS